MPSERSGRTIPSSSSPGIAGQHFDSDFANEHEFDLIRKPYSPRELFAKIKEILDQE